MRSANRRSMNETNSFLLKKPSIKYQSVDHLNQYPPPPPPPPPPPTKLEFVSSSPQIILGEASPRHSSHPQHPLSLLDLPDLFTCSGCKEFGSGFRLTFHQCEFQLHEFCALAPPVLKNHDFHRQHHLIFHSKPVKGGIMKSKCDVCWKPTKGYTFRCNACSFQMHPCCALLSTEINISVHPHPLKLLPAATNVSSSSSSQNGAVDPAAGFLCGECKKKKSGRMYRCKVCEYHLHAVCAKSMVNGLEANGIKGTEKPGMLTTAVRVASVVVKEFIEGIIEGFGESVGEMIFQSIPRAGRQPDGAAAANAPLIRY